MKDELATRFDLPARAKPASLNLNTPTRELAGTYDAPTTIVAISAESGSHSARAQRPPEQALVSDPLLRDATLFEPLPGAPALTQSDATQFSPVVIPNELPPAPSPLVGEPSTPTTERRQKVPTKHRGRRTGLVQIVVGAMLAAGVTSASAFAVLFWWSGQDAHKPQASPVVAGPQSSEISFLLPKVQPVPPPSPPRRAPPLQRESVEDVAPGSEALALKALEALRAGRIAEAIFAYQKLATESANARTYRLAASILEKKLRRQKKAEEQSP